MIIRSITHCGLQWPIEDDDPRRLSLDLVPRIRNILSFLLLSRDMEEFIRGAPPGWRIHRLSGPRRGQWSVSVSGNWRIAFEEPEGHIDGLYLEDYH